MTLCEFEEYYCNVSCSVHEFGDFERLMRDAWHVPGGSSCNSADLLAADGSQSVEEVQDDLGPQFPSDDQRLQNDAVAREASRTPRPEDSWKAWTTQQGHAQGTDAPAWGDISLCFHKGFESFSSHDENDDISLSREREREREREDRLSLSPKSIRRAALMKIGQRVSKRKADICGNGRANALRQRERGRRLGC